MGDPTKKWADLSAFSTEWCWKETLGFNKNVRKRWRKSKAIIKTSIEKQWADYTSFCNNMSDWFPVWCCLETRELHVNIWIHKLKKIKGQKNINWQQRKQIIPTAITCNFCKSYAIYDDWGFYTYSILVKVCLETWKLDLKTLTASDPVLLQISL